MHRLFHNLASSPSTSAASFTYHREALKRAYARPFDRVNELGNDEGYGHTGCVNSLSWELNGDVLLSGGDDTTVRIWRQDTNDLTTPYPYKECAIIKTGHTGNIFNARLLPSSSRIATVAGDRRVRVFDAEHALTAVPNGKGSEFSERETCIRVFKCHSGRTKRIVTEESPDVFLTVAEDGAVRQHDLRMQHQCDRRGQCPPPLVTLPHDLSALALSPLAPHLFVVAGESPYGYLFDRRQVGRTIRTEWGVPCDDDSSVTCVRRFGRPETNEDERGIEHITGARMAQTNGHEFMDGCNAEVPRTAYSADAVYLYSIRDDPQEEQTRPSSVLKPNSTDKNTDCSFTRTNTDTNIKPEDVPIPDSDSFSTSSIARSLSHLTSETEDDNLTLEDEEDDEEDDEDDEDGEDEDGDVASLELDEKFKTPVLMPRRKFVGHCNVETVKDVNFIGPEDEYVASGSDDGNFFLWKKSTGQICGIYEGDQAVVNVIEGHPRLPLIACSGIDTTVKLFAPTEKLAVFSRMQNMDSITRRNAAQARMSARAQTSGFARLLWHYRLALRRAAEESEGL
ncbi:hypothetical protein ACEPAG_6486 [Sanghuangporus baumii]